MLFRSMGIKPGEEVIVDYTGNNLVMKKSPTNIVAIAVAISKAIAKSGKKVKVTTELLKQLDEEEIEEKYERISRQRLSRQ